MQLCWRLKQALSCCWKLLELREQRFEAYILCLSLVWKGWITFHAGKASPKAAISRTEPEATSAFLARPAGSKAPSRAGNLRLVVSFTLPLNGKCSKPIIHPSQTRDNLRVPQQTQLSLRGFSSLCNRRSDAKTPVLKTTLLKRESRCARVWRQQGQGRYSSTRPR